METIHLTNLNRVREDQHDEIQKVYSEAKVRVILKAPGYWLIFFENTADAEHKIELQKLRWQSDATIEQITSANREALHDTQASLSAEADERVEKLQKRLSEAELELQATQEDLHKSKLSLSGKCIELEAVTLQVQKMHAEKSASSVFSASHSDAGVHKELETTRDELRGLRAAFQATKESMASMLTHHRRELEGVERTHVDELADLGRKSAQEKSDLLDAKDAAQTRIRELEIEINNAERNAQMLVMSPPAESQGVTSVTREELARMHEAHNLKLHTVDAEHRQVLQLMSNSIEQLIRDKEELRSAAERREMEIHFLSTENEENADRIKRYVISRNSFVLFLGVVVFRLLL